MYKYTAHPEVLRKLASIQKNSKRPWDAQFYYALEITGNYQTYFMIGNFWRKYKELQFYSPKVLREVPVNGVYLPAYWFLETKVS